MQTSSFIERLLKRPSLIFAFLTLFIFLGIMGYQKIERKLFPDSNYPQIAVVMVQNGASAKSMASNIAVPSEEEFYTLERVRRVYSNTIDEVSVITVEFEYDKDIDAAANDVSNALSRLKRALPGTLEEPQIIKITSATAPVLTLALSPKDDSLTLSDIRDVAQSRIKQKLLLVDGVGSVAVYGGYAREVHIAVDKAKLERYHLTLSQLVAAVRANNQEFAAGFITNDDARYLLKASLRAERLDALNALVIAPSLTLGDVATITFSHHDNSALYYGNSKPSIALAISRGEADDVLKTIENIEVALETLQKEYTGIDFAISDTQKETIIQSTTNMFESLRDAIIMSTLVVFFFLASLRQVFVVLATIPLVYASTIALMWLVGIEFNVVTLTGVILALGLLLDDTVVVVENIERHYRQLHDTIENSVMHGTKEIMFADLSGTITTMIALAPMLFVGGYPQTVFQPLVGTLLLALLASYVISITAVPLLSLKILTFEHRYVMALEAGFGRFSHTIIGAIERFFESAVVLALRSKKVALLYFLVLFFLFFTSVKGVMPVVGKELMPPMDTGGVKIAIVAEPNLPIETSQKIVEAVEKILHQQGTILRISTAIGSEAGVVNVGSGSGVGGILINATYIDRYQREQSIWDIEKKLRHEIAKVPHIKQLDVVDYGATALASIRANLDVTLESHSLEDLNSAAAQIEAAMMQTQGIVSVSRSWHADKKVYECRIDAREASAYGITNAEVLAQLQLLLKGGIVSSFARENASDYPVRIWVQEDARSRVDSIQEHLIATPKGMIPLHKIASVHEVLEPLSITREGLMYTVNVYGFREKAAISHIMESFERASKDLVLPHGVSMRQSGDIAQFNESASRMVGAIGFAVVLILLTLIVLFESIKISLMILLSIPLTLIGASWTMLLLDYHTSMPAMMGFILLSGVIVNNAILLIHFALERMRQGVVKHTAMIEALRLRTRPVLMTAFAVTAGMLPVALGSAIGLERLAPLGAVAIGGLIVGTFLTLLFIPLLFIWSVASPASKTQS
jgi:multidrug efflux pump subunit AcrB